MSTDTIMNAGAVVGALAVLIFGTWILLTIPEVVSRYVAKRRAPKPVKITYRVGYGPPSPAEWAARKKAEEIRYGQHDPR